MLALAVFKLGFSPVEDKITTVKNQNLNCIGFVLLCIFFFFMVGMLFKAKTRFINAN